MVEPAYGDIARQVLRALRGPRSQVAWSRRLGYRSNVAYAWESGRRWPTASEAMRAASRTGIDVRASLIAFYGSEPRWLPQDPTTPAALALFMDDLRGSHPISALARESGLSRYALTRWLSGQTQPRLPDFFHYVEAASLRLVDFVTSFVAPEAVPAITPIWNRLEARRRGAFELPWTQAVIRAFELQDYRALPAHDTEWVAQRLGIDTAEAARCIDHLVDTGQLRWEGEHLALDALAVDTRRRPDVGRRLKQHWTQVAGSRIDAGAPGQFSYNVFTVSRADFERIRELHLQYYQELRNVVAASEPGECVAIANVQLFALDGEPEPPPE